MEYLTDRDYQIAKSNGIKKETAYARVYVYGWSVQRAITQKPVQHIIQKGLIKEWRPILQQTGIAEQTFYNRLKKGMTPEQAATTPHMPATQFRESRKGCGKIKLEHIEQAKKNGIGENTLKIRVYSYKWTPERACNEPIHTRFRRKTK